jgi:multidrug efflux pump subunit AcrB
VVENVKRVMEEHLELSPVEATKLAMQEITAPIIAITLVLLSVFVPIAFIPGISGELFRQFAVTVAVSMFISAINALTLSPALCGVFLKPHHGPRPGLVGKLMNAIDRAGWLNCGRAHKAFRSSVRDGRWRRWAPTDLTHHVHGSRPRTIKAVFRRRAMPGSVWREPPR